MQLRLPVNPSSAEFQRSCARVNRYNILEAFLRYLRAFLEQVNNVQIRAQQNMGYQPGRTLSRPMLV